VHRRKAFLYDVVTGEYTHLGGHIDDAMWPEDFWLGELPPPFGSNVAVDKSHALCVVRLERSAPHGSARFHDQMGRLVTVGPRTHQRPPAATLLLWRHAGSDVQRAILNLR
jgi:hypothetical protein